MGFLDYGSVYTNNTANQNTGYGGAIRMNNMQSASISFSRFYANKGLDGAGISFYSVQSMNVNSCEFYGNVAFSNGGALHFETVYNAVVINITAIGNIASNGIILDLLCFLVYFLFFI